MTIRFYAGWVAGQTRASLEIAVRQADVAVTTSLVEDPGIDATVKRFRDRMGPSTIAASQPAGIR